MDVSMSEPEWMLAPDSAGYGDVAFTDGDGSALPDARAPLLLPPAVVIMVTMSKRDAPKHIATRTAKRECRRTRPVPKVVDHFQITPLVRGNVRQRPRGESESVIRQRIPPVCSKRPTYM